MEVLQQFLVVIAVLAGLVGTLWTLQKRGFIRLAHAGLKTRGERKLQIVERLQLTPQHTLCLVRLDGKTLLIGTAPASCTVLNEEQPR